MTSVLTLEHYLVCALMTKIGLVTVFSSVLTVS
ncbi:MAG: hypothetical protein ACJA2G_000563, partial [Cognaticolwellia sp.]